jgi:hypothetical protein
MNTNQHIESPEDQLLFELIGKIPMEKAPDGFTAGIMQQVYSGVEPVSESPEYRRQMIWAYLGIGFALIIFIIMLFAQWPFLKINLPTDFNSFNSLLHAGLGFFDGLSRVISYVKNLSAIMIIFFALTVLLIVERIFRRGISQKSSFLF